MYTTASSKSSLDLPEMFHVRKVSSRKVENFPRINEGFLARGLGICYRILAEDVAIDLLVIYWIYLEVSLWYSSHSIEYNRFFSVCRLLSYTGVSQLPAMLACAY